jgi:2-polyprenyl-3-methyl-5-hydroxy-6-metoxy-1,4-benzoquinol methylase
MINSESAHQLIDEHAREAGLREVRATNFRTLLAEIKSLKPSGRLLDVGCAHGWFLELAARDFDALGIEPDQPVSTATAARGLAVRQGFFPDVLAADEQFDVIVFNDVIEHIPDIESTLAACHRHLKTGGVLVLNVPSSSGIFYKLAGLFHRLGAGGFFDRLWQKGFPSPHLHYFNPSNLARLLEKNGYANRRRGSLSTLHLSDLYTRISYDETRGRLERWLVYAGVVLLLPMLKLLPSDIIYAVSEKKG